MSLLVFLCDEDHETPPHMRDRLVIIKCLMTKKWQECIEETSRKENMGGRYGAAGDLLLLTTRSRSTRSFLLPDLEIPRFSSSCLRSTTRSELRGRPSIRGSGRLSAMIVVVS